MASSVGLTSTLTKDLSDRAEGNPFGYKTISRTSAIDLRTVVKYLAVHLGKDVDAVFLNEVTPEMVQTFPG